uniref:formate--tetrahydrofolate ligase n=1 Tax=Prevotella sp. TaxID=59823 RepID=UPI0040270B36
MKTDIEIAQETTLRRIDDIAKELGIDENHIEPYGRYIAKVSLDAIDEERMKRHNLILVTAISPTKAGIGKTTVSVGLALGLNKIGKKAVVALREPSLGPCFGMKGGACGGGYAQLLPMDKINLHFTGDFHAITTANNMIAALLDNYLYQHAKDGFRLKTILWKRVLDVNDRSLRQIITGLGPLTNGIPTQTGFDITPASEIMGIMCFAKDIDDLKRRVGNILLGFDYQDKPFYVRDMGVEGSIAVLLKDALKPNLVQTTEGTPAIVHCGPFANIAHGCNSVVATKMALTLGDYAITEAGFGADLGAEKFYDIKCRTAGLQPALTVLVVTLQALKMHGGVAYQNIKEPNIEAVKQGFWNLDKHVENIKRFGQKIVVAFNRYNNDTEEEIEAVRAHCQELGVGFAVNNAFAEGGKGAEELANTVVKTIEDTPSPKLQYLYKDDDSVKDKIEAVAKKIYGAGSVSFARKAETQLKHIYDLGLSGLPVCVAKTQYSFSVDPKAYGKTDGFHLDVADIVINSGSGMIVAIAGNILRMPGLPATPQANNIDIVDGKIVGLS